MREGAFSAVVEEGLTPGSARPCSGLYRPALVGGGRVVVEEYSLL